MQTPLLPSANLTEKLFEELLTELRAERSNMREQHHELVKERKTERRWKTFFQLALIGIPLLGTIAYVIFFTSAMGFMAKSHRRAWRRRNTSFPFSRRRSRTQA